jgi:hypothetical protein
MCLSFKILKIMQILYYNMTFAGMFSLYLIVIFQFHETAHSSASVRIACATFLDNFFS